MATTYHLVAVNCIIWQKGDERTSPVFWSFADDENDLNDRLWVVDGKLLPLSRRNVVKITEALGNALEFRGERTIPGVTVPGGRAVTQMVYEVVKEVMCFQFRVMGTGSYHHPFGDLDWQAGEDDLDEVFGHDIDELIRIAKRKFEANQFDNWITFITLWTHHIYTSHTPDGNDVDFEWYFVGVVDMPKIWDTLEQLPGDQCSKCRSTGFQQPINFDLALDDRPKCPYCVKGTIQSTEKSQ